MKKIFALFILLILSSVLFAADEIQFSYESGHNIYAVIRDSNSPPLVWNKAVTPAGWRTWVDANITDYNLPLTDNGGDDYSTSVPAGITTAGILKVNIYQLVSIPATTDLLIGAGEILWDGSAEINIYTISQDANQVIPRMTANFGAGPYTSDMNETDIKGYIDAELEDYNSPTKTRDAIFAKTGITTGGTWTYEKILKLQTAWLIGEWQDKADEEGVYQILDAEDQNTVIIDVNVNTMSKYKKITVH
jgi:hypothetical protein